MASNHQTYETDKNQLLITQGSLLKKKKKAYLEVRDVELVVD